MPKIYFKKIHIKAPKNWDFWIFQIVRIPSGLLQDSFRAVRIAYGLLLEFRTFFRVFSAEFPLNFPIKV
jgi:hypothetical protein